DFSAKLAVLALHREPDAVKHEPCSFLSNAKRAVKLPRANAVLVVDDHPDGRQPFVQAKRRVLEYRSGLQAELWAVVLAVALPHARLFEIDHVVGISARTAYNAVRPAKFHHECATVLEVLEVDNRFSQCASQFHDSDNSNSLLVW